MKILIGADIVPTEHDLALFSSGDASAIVGDAVKAELDSADIRIFNLETPLTDKATPIAKNGPHLITPTAAIAGYKALGADLVTIANNHIMDQGEQGLRSTMATLDKAGIAYLGCGDSIAEASKPYIIERRGKKIGVYACAEHEFSIVDEDKAGANPFDPLECPDRVAALKSECDYVIVLYHGGREFYRYPLPELQKNCRKLAQKGADLVICQHTHCIGCAENYEGSTIVYGQGNFIFERVSNEYWNSGLLVCVELDDTAQVSYIPLVKTEHRVRAADETAAAEILSGFSERSDEITRPGFVKQRLKQEANKNSLRLARVMAGDRLLHKVLYKAAPGLLRKMLLGKEQRLKKYNLIACQSHREVLLSGLEE